MFRISIFEFSAITISEIESFPLIRRLIFSISFIFKWFVPFQFIAFEEEKNGTIYLRPADLSSRINRTGSFWKLLWRQLLHRIALQFQRFPPANGKEQKCEFQKLLYKRYMQT